MVFFLNEHKKTLKKTSSNKNANNTSFTSMTLSEISKISNIRKSRLSIIPNNTESSFVDLTSLKNTNTSWFENNSLDSSKSNIQITKRKQSLPKQLQIEYAESVKSHKCKYLCNKKIYKRTMISIGKNDHIMAYKESLFKIYNILETQNKTKTILIYGNNEVIHYLPYNNEPISDLDNMGCRFISSPRSEFNNVLLMYKTVFIWYDNFQFIRKDIFDELQFNLTHIPDSTKEGFYISNNEEIVQFCNKNSITSVNNDFNCCDSTWTTFMMSFLPRKYELVIEYLTGQKLDYIIYIDYKNEIIFFLLEEVPEFLKIYILEYHHNTDYACYITTLSRDSIDYLSSRNCNDFILIERKLLINSHNLH